MVNRMMVFENHDNEQSDFVEVDPTGRYGRYNEILGKGSSKIVYRAFDEYQGIEVAWNQVKLYDFLQRPEDLERLYCEIHLLKTLKHKNIMKFYTSWVDTTKRTINFITEMFTSGTLRQYRQKHRRVNLWAVKHWCRQILSGVLYLHSHDPPIIHRDLKCDNIFINGNQGEVKIGDLGLAAILRKSHAAHCVGTPEFMAPEVYAEEYNELVDIYSFGMCVLEMVTFEYPYSECKHPAQIYKKVTSNMYRLMPPSFYGRGTKPQALYKVKDPEVRQFIEKCLATASKRLSSRELLKDPFLQVDDLSTGYWDTWDTECNGICQISRQPSANHFISNNSFNTEEYSHFKLYESELENGWDFGVVNIENHGINLFNGHEDDPPAEDVDITIKGRKNDDGGVFLRLRIADKEGRVRNIYFPFDIETDTALSVATEMVGELDITDHDVTRIAEMIDEEVASLVPGWKPGPGFEETPGIPGLGLCDSCKSNVSSCGSLLDYLSYKNVGADKLQPIHCSRVECAAMHGRFEEITFQFEGSHEHNVKEGAPALSSSHSDGLDLCSQTSLRSHAEEIEQSEHCMRDGRVTHQDNENPDEQPRSNQHDRTDEPESSCHSQTPVVLDNNEKEAQQETRWMKGKFHMELRDYKSQKLEELRRSLSQSPLDENEHREKNGILKSFHFAPMISPRIACENNHPPITATCHADQGEEANWGNPEIMFTLKNFYTGGFPVSLGRQSSLPADAVNI